MTWCMVTIGLHVISLNFGYLKEQSIMDCTYCTMCCDILILVVLWVIVDTLSGTSTWWAPWCQGSVAGSRTGRKWLCRVWWALCPRHRYSDQTRSCVTRPGNTACSTGSLQVHKYSKYTVQVHQVHSTRTQSTQYKYNNTQYKYKEQVQEVHSTSTPSTGSTHYKYRGYFKYKVK